MPETARDESRTRHAAPEARDPELLIPAAWISRVYAAAVDGAIVMLLTAPVMAVLVLTGAVHPPRYNGVLSTQFMFTLAIVLTFFVFLYPTLWIAYKKGQTVGKRMLGIRVVRNDGSFLGLAHAALREVVVKQLMFGFAASFSFGAIQVLDVLWPFADRRNRCLHDIVARTRVIEVLDSGVAS